MDGAVTYHLGKNSEASEEDGAPRGKGLTLFTLMPNIVGTH